MIATLRDSEIDCGTIFGIITIYSQAHDKLDFFHFGSLPIINTSDWPEIFTVASQHTL